MTRSSSPKYPRVSAAGARGGAPTPPPPPPAPRSPPPPPAWSAEVDRLPRFLLFTVTVTYQVDKINHADHQ